VLSAAEGSGGKVRTCNQEWPPPSKKRLSCWSPEKRSAVAFGEKKRKALEGGRKNLYLQTKWGRGIP